MIILNETSWAEDMIRRRDLGMHPYETMCRVARYYIDMGLNKKQAREKLCTFIERSAPNMSVVSMSSKIDSAVSHALKHKAINIDGIPVTKNEIDIIGNVAGTQSKRLAFTLLCLSKYWNIYNDTNTYWVVDRGNEIMKIANIKTSGRRQGKLYSDLRDAGLISFSKKVDNTNVRVNFADEESEVAMIVPDLVDVGNRYLMYTGQPFFECQECGSITKMDNPSARRAQKYCKQCASKVKAQQQLEYMRRKRLKNVEKSEPQFLA